ncbi:MAG TPA: ABC transporter ATP-binding protein [Blastocatellia bacterium]|nr:ABC transporter ATP-binding protein [Blastocatellia bacterium]
MNTSAEPTGEIVIQIDGLTKDYEVGFLKKKTVHALDHLSLKVYRGEIFGFLGPNGAGKTTTLKLLMRLIYPTRGSARILGLPFEDATTRSRVGYLPENPYFYDYLSGRELLGYTGALFGLSRSQIADRAPNLLATVGLDDERADRQLRKYSKGMLQRIGIAQALINDPEILFLDEPMSGLDPVGRREIRDLLLTLREQGKTIFFSSHILSDVEALCDRAAILSRGRLLRSGTIVEMTGEETTALEVVAAGVAGESIDSISRALPQIREVTATPNGVHFIIEDESRIDDALRLIREAGGKLVSVNSRRRSLEDVFSRTEQGI